jgi:hypothetical protein
VTNTSGNHDDLHCTNKLGRIVLLALEEMLGNTGVTSMLYQAGLPHLINNYPPNNLDAGFPFGDLASIHQTLDALYGPRGGRGVALRAGRACLKYGMIEFGPVPGVSEQNFRLLPLASKIRVGAQAFANTINQHSDHPLQFEESPEGFLWTIERCPICWGRHSDSPCCHLLVGVLQEALFWLSCGRNYRVEEISCVAKGDSACSILIDRHPID